MRIAPGAPTWWPLILNCQRERCTILEVFKHQLRTRQEYSINAAFDFDFHIKWCHWQHEKQLMQYRGGAEEITVVGVAGLAALIAGQDTDHPSFEGYNPSHRVRNGLALDHGPNEPMD